MDLGERALAELADRARSFARAPPREKAALLRSTLPRLLAAAPDLAAAICSARGLDPASPAAAEAWLAGVAPVIAYARALAEALEDLASSGRPSLPAAALDRRPGGRVVARLPPRTRWERLAESGRETTVLFSEGMQKEDVISGQAAFYRQTAPEGGVALVIPDERDATVGVMDALFALFVDGRVAILAPPRSSTAAGAVAAHALAPLVERGFLRVLPGDLSPGDESAGEHLAAHPGLSAVLRGAPRNVGAILVVPCLHAKDDLAHLARSTAAQIAYGDAMDVAAPGVLVLPTGWAQRALFLEMLDAAVTALARSPAREPGSSPIPVASVGSDDPAEFLAAAVDLCDERFGETCSAQIVVHEIHEEDPEIGAALERAVIRLRCGAVGVNRWPALLAWAAVPPWGDAVAGFRHNARMLAGVDKVVLRGPLRAAREPAYLARGGRALRLAERVAAFQAAPRARGVWDVLGR